MSLDSESEIVSARAAVDIGVDVLLGGTRVECVLPILQGSGIQYFPFPGRISGHPSVLEGSIEEIVQSAKAITAHEGVHGLDLLASALANLVENALKYACQQPGGQITITAQQHAAVVELRIQDNGPGVPPERLHQLTQRFFRAHERQPGHGLGLSSVQAIVALHDGQLSFANLHPGFEVRLTLPAAPAA